MSAPIDMTGQVLGRLTVVRRAGSTKDGKARWDCVCVCGRTLAVEGKSLRTGNTRSCGCLKAEGNAFRHGKCHTPEWVVWCSMRQRCSDPKTKSYVDYGGRGIRVCRRWSEFLSFFEDMGKRPAGCSIDRIDTNGNYTPKNCRWATRKQQNRNTRRNRFLVYRAQRRCLSEWCELLALEYGTTLTRLNLGWSVTKAFTQEVR